MTKKTSFTIMAVAGAFMAAGTASADIVTSADGTVTGYAVAADSRAPLSAAQLTNAKSAMPMLSDRTQIPGYAGSPFSNQQYGDFFQHPFTTKRVAVRNDTYCTPTNMGNYRKAGKLFMLFPEGFFVCSASVVETGVLVTAAHCIHRYGEGEPGFSSRVVYQPARNEGMLPFGQWEATSWHVPTAYYNGTDDCEVTGIVCANDVATVTLDTNEMGKNIKQVTGRLLTWTNSKGYGNFDPTFSGTPLMKAAHLTALGYPQAHDGGAKMMRTDSFGFQTTPNNVVMGSAQTGGSSGGPWIQNFGSASSFAGSTTNFSQGNRVSAVTSWGYTSDTIKVQGASRFGHNVIFPKGGPTNIKAVITAACEFDATKCG